MTRTLPLSEVKIKFSQLVEGIVSKDDEVIITRSGKPVAVLMSSDEYESRKETRAIQNDPDLSREIKRGLQALQKGKARKFSSLDELFG